MCVPAGARALAVLMCMCKRRFNGVLWGGSCLGNVLRLSGGHRQPRPSVPSAGAPQITGHAVCIAIISYSSVRHVRCSYSDGHGLHKRLHGLRGARSRSGRHADLGRRWHDAVRWYSGLFWGDRRVSGSPRDGARRGRPLSCSPCTPPCDTLASELSIR